MAMNSLVVILSFQLASSAVYCPMNHCLKRTASGNSASSFSCEQYVDKGYQCAGEGQTCKCAGMVKYGNFAQASKKETWSAEKKVADLIACTNTAMGGDPVSGAKVCWCRPDSLATTVRSTCDPSEDAAPTCIITPIKITLTGMPPNLAYGMGYNEGVANMLVGGIIDKHFGTSRTTGLSFNETTLTTLLKIPCANAYDCMSLLDNSGPADFKTTSDAYIDANLEALGQLAGFKTLLSYEVPFTPRGSAPCVINEPPMTCGAVKEEYKKNKCCGADPAKPFAGSARRLTEKAKEEQEETELLDSIRIALAKAEAEGGAATAKKFAKTIAGIVEPHIQY